MRHCLVLSVLVLLAVGAGAAHASGDPYKDQADTVPCPRAPSGWFNPPASEGGRSVLTPLSTLNSPDGLDAYSAAPAVEIDCNYRTAGGKDLEVSVRYALPIDLNPWNDFDIGCTEVAHPEAVSTASERWNDRVRVYRIVGMKSWSLATFIDNLHQLSSADVPRFEAMANELLKGVQSFAHNCSLPGNHGPVAVKSLWTFSFDAHVTSAGIASSADTTGSFTTSPTADGSSIGAIGDLNATDFRLRMSQGGHTSWISIHIAAPIGFEHSYGSELRARIVVLGSSEPGCRSGSTGTLFLATPLLAPPTVRITICGHSYLSGKGSVSATIASV